MISRRVRVGAVIAAVAVAAPMIVNAAPSPRNSGFCDSFLSFLCPKEDPHPGTTSTPTPSPAPGTPGSDKVPDAVDELPPEAETPIAPEKEDAPDAPDAPEADEAPVPAPVDESAPVFTKTPAAMGAGGLSFTGLRGISIVSVPTIDGGSVRALKVEADSITISGFSLTVRPPDGPGLVTTADTMSLAGDVSVYLGSVTATTADGKGITLGLATPPALGEVEPGLLNVSMGLVGTIADSIHYTNTDQNIVEP